MDISNLLPLIMSMNKQKKGSESQGDQPSATSDGGLLSGDNLGLLMSAMKGGGDKTKIISQLAAKQNPQLAQIMSLTSAISSEPPKHIGGLKAIKSIADNVIVGRIAKY